MSTTRAYLSLGSNVEPERHIRAAIDALRARFGDVVVSPVYRVPAVGFDGPDFLNAAAIIDSDLDPFALVRWLQDLERDNGRIRGHVKFSDRTLDVDLVYFGDLVLETPELQLPRPELRHAFVLRPLADIAPAFVDPVRQVTLSDLWSAHAEHGAHLDIVAL
ncbi:2-amino-4-hydroxy-6-hydroxymethyldihydropteridine diphosphokinase [Lysobacter helvus]|uniref:2-amino-4-hydroxy-6-hydroxymethyldihydropteridine pyrophosphokinase n=2 Tax=Lysobacteraceae TaxID=32033 RepID=A0ABM7Q589_9GAMM|nr:MULTISPECIES: 2-amino-4-hydroxy-6-hydroxymethyldihydropteridine diphosphokinase [Lysobacter]BCT92414.1 2-amino-4-hydroxy-6-hydroxymethyldihydropteridine diphosphokinase [Lysobacter caseinilyticus]BCT95567.1 2-amino-4-hydroxy-6-hydroxymethyldihydropteridine diphosphokinase [Lysobacter helvus]